MLEFQKTYGVAVETSGRIGSIAIGQGDSVLFESYFSGSMKHSAELFDTLNHLIDRVGIRPGQIDPLYITVGPGSFTGIRIAVTLAKMLGYAAGTRIVAVDTLDALVENATDFFSTIDSDLRRAATILDAKQNRFFVAIYEKNGEKWEKIHPDSLLHPDDILAIIQRDNIPTALLGEGLVYYGDRFESPLTTRLDKSFWTVSARKVYQVGRAMAQKGLFSDTNSLVPAYIRKPDAVEKRERQLKKGE